MQVFHFSDDTILCCLPLHVCLFYVVGNVCCFHQEHLFKLKSHQMISWTKSQSCFLQ